MILLRSFTDIPSTLRGGALSIGNFDGIHQGHAQIVAQLVARARSLDCPAIVFTFDPSPAQLLRPDSAPPSLSWLDQKAAMLGELGVDAVIAYPTDLEILSLAPEAFFRSLVIEQLGARGMVEGPNFYFGHARAGDINDLAQLCKQAEISLDIVSPVEIDGAMVSSSRIRERIQEGDVAGAAQLLARPYQVRGEIQPGAQRGAEIGFPTANMEGIKNLLPRVGVYAGSAIVEGKKWPAAIHIGPNPTFSEDALKVEVHLIGFEGELYEQILEVDFLQRLRDIQSFPSVESLVEQIRQDVEAVIKIASQ